MTPRKPSTPDPDRARPRSQRLLAARAKLYRAALRASLRKPAR